MKTNSQRQVFIIIQARMTSTRLPGKVMLPIGQSTVLGVLLKRIEKYRSKVIVATTSDGFTHRATCEFEGDGWLRNFCVEHFDWGCATLGDVVDNY